MIRTIFNLLFIAVIGVSPSICLASDAIPFPDAPGSVSPAVSKPHVVAQLISSTSAPGTQPFTLALRLKMDPGWHTYWINPGEAGLETRITWTLPEGWKAGPIQWPVPEIHSMGPIVTYGYEGETYLLTTITPGGKPVANPVIKAKVSWLVCQEECIPGDADLSITFPGKKPVQKAGELDSFFAAAQARVPRLSDWKVAAAYTGDKLIVTLSGMAGDLSAYRGGLMDLSVEPIVDAAKFTGHELYFFSETPNVLSEHQTGANHLVASKSASDPDALSITIPLAQNGDKPDSLSAVVVVDPGANQQVFQLPEFKITTSTASAQSPGAGTSSAASGANTDPRAGAASDGSTKTGLADSSPVLGNATLVTIVLAAGGAFIGGLILNLMPCVLPVLSLKVYALMRHAHGDSTHHRSALPQGLAYTGGVLVSFWLLAGLLLLLRAAGNQVGWGFQLSSPGFVLFLACLFFLLALNLFGVFEMGSSLVGLDAKVTQNLDGLFSSFCNGALATLAATPCTGPFMGSSIGFAAQQSIGVGFVIFTSLALGMASPFILLTAWPALLKKVPKPGVWTESFRQFLGFLLAFTVVYFVYVFGTLTSPDKVPWLLAVLILFGMGAWIYGRWIQNPIAKSRLLPSLALVPLAIACYFQLADLLRPAAATAWEAYSPEKVDQAIQEHRPVFCDFTASWCLSCKVNEYVALENDATKAAFAQKNVLLLKGDWSHADPIITKTLHQYNRDGVPMYLLFSGKSDKPQILPEVLTPGMVQDAVKQL